MDLDNASPPPSRTESQARADGLRQRFGGLDGPGGTFRLGGSPDAPRRRSHDHDAGWTAEARRRDQQARAARANAALRYPARREGRGDQGEVAEQRTLAIGMGNIQAAQDTSARLAGQANVFVLGQMLIGSPTSMAMHLTLAGAILNRPGGAPEVNPALADFIRLLPDSVREAVMDAAAHAVKLGNSIEIADTCVSMPRDIFFSALASIAARFIVLHRAAHRLEVPDEGRLAYALRDAGEHQLQNALGRSLDVLGGVMGRTVGGHSVDPFNPLVGSASVKSSAKPESSAKEPAGSSQKCHLCHQKGHKKAQCPKKKG